MELRRLYWDFEVKKDYWCVSFLDDEGNYNTFEDGQQLELSDFIFKHKQDTIFVGYNNVWFDNWCLKAVLFGVNPYRVVHHCIENKESPYTIKELRGKKFDIMSFDCMIVLGRSAPSLKDIEGNLGIDIMMDKTIDKDKWQALTRQEKDELIRYNRQDVKATRDLFYEIKDDFDAYMTLITTFNLSYDILSKPKAKIVSSIFGSKIRKQLQPYSFKYSAPSFIKLSNTEVLDKIQLFDFTEDNQFECTFDYNGYDYVIKRGGAHYAIANYCKEFDGDTIMVCNDFDSFYPQMMANPVNPELRYIDYVLPWEEFRRIVDMRLDAKKTNKQLAKALKIPINATYGNLIYKNSGMNYWPAGLSVCLTGQLITLMVCQKLEQMHIGKLIQVNTDGFYYELKKKDLDVFNQEMDNFQNQIGITFERTIIEHGSIYQKDVNNYVMYNKDTGSVKCKGDYVKRYNTLVKYMSYSTAIIDEAIVKYLVFKEPVSKTVMDAYNNNEVKKFQMIYNMKGKNWEGCYKCWWNQDGLLSKNEKIQKINRGFASGDKTLPDIRRLKGTTYHKFDDKPEHVYIYNGSLDNFDIRKIMLDVQWYINLANKGIDAFLGKR